jgi:hypothetical protein
VVRHHGSGAGDGGGGSWEDPMEKELLGQGPS